MIAHCDFCGMKFNPRQEGQKVCDDCQAGLDLTAGDQEED